MHLGREVASRLKVCEFRKGWTMSPRQGWNLAALVAAGACFLLTETSAEARHCHRHRGCCGGYYGAGYSGGGSGCSTGGYSGSGCCGGAMTANYGAPCGQTYTGGPQGGPTQAYGGLTSDDGRT